MSFLGTALKATSDFEQKNITAFWSGYMVVVMGGLFGATPLLYVSLAGSAQIAATAISGTVFGVGAAIPFATAFYRSQTGHQYEALQDEEKVENAKPNYGTMIQLTLS